MKYKKFEVMITYTNTVTRFIECNSKKRAERLGHQTARGICGAKRSNAKIKVKEVN